MCLRINIWLYTVKKYTVNQEKVRQKYLVCTGLSFDDILQLQLHASLLI